MVGSALLRRLASQSANLVRIGTGKSTTPTLCVLSRSESTSTVETRRKIKSFNLTHFHFSKWLWNFSHGKEIRSCAKRKPDRFWQVCCWLHAQICAKGSVDGRWRIGSAHFTRRHHSRLVLFKGSPQCTVYQFGWYRWRWHANERVPIRSGLQFAIPALQCQN